MFERVNASLVKKIQNIELLTRGRSFFVRLPLVLVSLGLYIALATLHVVSLLFSPSAQSFQTIHTLNPTRGYTTSYTEHVQLKRKFQFWTLVTVSAAVCVNVFVGVLTSNVRPAYAAFVRTWDGGGTDGTCGGGAGDGNKWSCGLNWSGDTAPAVGDTATFDATSTKAATIDAGFTTGVTTLNINSGYTGTITQARSFTVSGNTTFAGAATFTGSSDALTFTGTYNQSAGTFTGVGAVTHTGVLTITGGTYNATPGTTTLGSVITHTGAGTFNNNSGSVVLTGSASASFDVNVSETFYNLEFNKSNLVGIGVASADTLVVTNVLTLTNGSLAGTGTGKVESTGTISVGSGWDGVTSYTTGNLLIDGTNIATLSIPGGQVALAGTVTLNNANYTINGTGAGTLNMYNMVLTAGTFDSTGYSTTFAGTFNENGGTFTPGSGTITHTGAFTLTTGTYPASSGTTTFSSTYTQNNGTFTGGSGTVTHTGTATLSAGIYDATTGTTNIVNWTHTAGGTFNNNSGRVVFTGASNINGIDVMVTETFYDLEFNKNNNTYAGIVAADTLLVTHTLYLTNGAWGYGTVESTGTISVGAGWDGYPTASTIGALLIDGINTATLSLPGGQTAIAASVVLNNANYTINGTGTGLLNMAAFTLTAGTFDSTGYNTTFASTFNENGGTFTPGSGTITHTGAFTLTTGTYPASSGSTIFSSTYTQNAGTFNGGSGTVTHTGTATLSLGTYNATTGTTNIVNWTHTAGGTFNNSSGRVVFTGATNLNGIDVMSTETFYDLEFNKNNGAYAGIVAADTLLVTHTLYLTNGAWGYGTVESTGTISVGAGWDGYPTASTIGLLLIDGTNVATLSIPGGQPAISPNVTLNNANYTINGTGAGLLNMAGLNLKAGTFDSTGYSTTFATTFTEDGGTFIPGSGTITHTGAFTLTSGTYPASSGSTIFTSTFTQNAGTFNGGSGAITYNGTFTLAGGIYNATTGTTTVASNWTHTAGGTFNNDSGKVMLTGISNDNGIDVMVTETFYDLEINKNNLAYAGIVTADTLLVTHALTLTNGAFYRGTVESTGTISYVAGGWDGVTAANAATLLIDGSNVSTLSLTGGQSALAGTITLNNATYTIDGTGAGTLNFSVFNLQAGTFNSTGYATTFASTFTQSGGTFTGGSNTITHTGAYTLSSGTYNASSGNTNVANTWTHTAGGTFNNSGGTVTAAIASSVAWNFATSETFYNFTLNATSGWTLTITSGKTLIVANTATLTNGTIGTGTLEVQGDVTVDSTFDGGTASVAVKFQNSTAAQSFNLTTYTGWNIATTIDKASGTVTLATDFTSTGTFTLTNGSFDQGVHTVTLGAAFSQTGGIYVAAAGTFDLNSSFTLSGGTYNASSGAMSVLGAWTHTVGGTFNHDNGTVTADLTGSVIWNFATSETFYNFTLAANSGWTLTITSGKTLIVTNTTTLTNGALGTGTFEARGNVVVNSGFDGGTASVGFKFQNSTADQSFDLTTYTGWNIATTIDKASGTVTLATDFTSTGTFTLTNGSFDQGVHTVTLGAAFSQTGGIYVAAAGTFDLNNSFTLSGGIYNASSGAMSVSGTWTHTAGGTFNHDNGSVTADYGSSLAWDVTSSETFYNFTLLSAGFTLTLAANDDIITLGTLTLNNGALSATAGHGVQAQGNVSIPSTYDGGTAQLTFNGTGTQTFTLGAVGVFNADIIVNSGAGNIVQLLSAITLDAASQDLTVTSGTFDINGFTLIDNGTSGTLVVQSGGALQMQGGETVTLNASNPTLQAGSTVAYNGTSGPYTMKDWTYTNATVVINGGATSVFTLPGTKTFANTTITSGILSLNGNGFTTTTAFNNSGTLRLRGNETISLTMDTDSGTVEFTGDGDALADTYTVTTLSATYYNLTINSTDAATDIFQLGAALDVNNAFTNTAGSFTVSASNYPITVGGNFSNTGTFTAGTGTVTFDDATKTSTIAGSTTFSGFSCVTQDKALTFTAGSNQTISGLFTLTGAASHVILLRSTVTDTWWGLTLNGTQNITYVDVKDSDASAGTTASPGVGTLNSLNNLNWYFNVKPVAIAASITTNEDTTYNGTLTGTDTESAALTYSIVGNGSSGTATVTNSATGAFQYVPTGNVNGSDSFTFKVNDGVQDSDPATISVTINVVNDVPSFTKGSNQTVLEDAGAQTAAAWATSISSGPANESAQTVAFNIANDNNGLFSSQPAINTATGDLTYTPAANANGATTVTISLSDTGGTANGGVDKSADQTFTITVTAVNDAPSAPITLYSNTTANTAQAGLTNPASIGDSTPAFSAVYVDNDTSDTANRYCIQVNTASDWSGTNMWYSDAAACATGSIITNITAGNRSTDIQYAGTAFSCDTTYYWGIKFWDDEPSAGAWSAAANFQIPCAAPSGLGATAYVNGSNGTDTTPTLSFTTSDVDGYTVQYEIQIDDSSDFNSRVVDYTSVLGAAGASTFTVGQAAGSGSYTTGSELQTLPYGSYYWRVKKIDQYGTATSYTTANSGSVAFVIKVYTVTNSNGVAASDAGGCDSACSLREAITAANADAYSPRIIEFNIDNDSTAGKGDSGTAKDAGCTEDLECTIAPTTVLPSITVANTTINGYTQSGAAANSAVPPAALNTVLRIVLNGAGAGAVNGLTVNNVANALIKGLVVNGYSNTGYNGIQVTGAVATGAVIQGCFLGTNVAGTAASANYRNVNLNGGGGSGSILGTDGDGVADVSEINLLSGSTNASIYVTSNSNTIAGNYIGTNSAGTAAIANAWGLYITTASNRIGTNGDGTSDVLERNLISGNTGANAVYINGAGATGNRIAGNYIGTNAAGTAALANGYGVNIGSGASNVIGTNSDGNGDVAEGNVISGNSIYGVLLNTNSNTLAGNIIGLNAAGTAAIANTSAAVFVGGVSNNIIGTNGNGSQDTFEGNVISGNSSYGIQLAGSSGTIIAGNLIGLTAASADAGNGGHGIIAYSGAVNTVVGGDIAAEANTIAYNGDGAGEYGIFVKDATSDGNQFLRNSIFSNQIAGIKLNGDDSNGNKVSPTISSIAPNNNTLNITGTATIGDTVQLFKDDGAGQSKTYIDQVTADGSGNWTVTIGSPYNTTGIRLVATATDVTNGTSAESSVTTVTNQAPVATAQTISGTEETNSTVTLAGTDGNGDTITAYKISAAPAAGSLYQTADGTTLGALISIYPTTVTDSSHRVIFVPVANGNGAGYGNFGIKVNDGTVDSAQATITVNVAAVNDPTIANSASLTTNEDTTYTGTLTSVEVDGDPLTYSVVADGSKGSAVITNTATGAFQYIPNANANGSDSFTFKVNDGVTDSNTATISVTINVVDDAPSFTKGLDQTVLEDAGAQTATGWATAISPGPADESGQAVNFVVSNDNNGLFSAQPSVGITGNLFYTPAANANGSSTITIHAHDDAGANSADQTFTITVTAVNDVPSFTKGADQTVLEDAGAQTATGWATAINKGTSNESVQTVNFVVSNDNNGLFSSQPAVASNGNLTYTPAANANGSTTVTIHIHDDGGTTNSGSDTSADQTFAITVTAVNDTPVANAASITTNEDTTYTGTLTGSDVEGSALTYSIVSNGTHGTATITNSVTGAFNYIPSPEVNGSDSFTFKVNDGTVDSSTATISVTITPVNDAPIALDASLSATEDTTATGTLTSIEVDGDPVTYSIVVNGSKGTATVTNSTTGAFQYVPNANSNGSDSFTFKANDGVVDSTAGTISVTISSVNDIPSFTKGSNQTVLEDAGAQTAAAWATSISAGPSNESGQVVTFVATNDNNGLFSTQPVVASNGNLTYTPTADANGSATVTIHVHDDAGADSADQTFTITVTAVNDVPSFTKGSSQVVLKDSGAHTVTGWATAVSAGPANESAQALTFIISNDNNSLFSSQPTVAVNGDLTFTPTANTAGSATVTIHAHDDGGTANSGSDTSADQTFIITVTVVNHTPTFSGTLADLSTLEDITISPAVNLNTYFADSDIGDSCTYSITNDVDSALGKLTVNNDGTISFKPTANASGTDTVQIRCTDQLGATADSNTFTITVTSVNDAPNVAIIPDQFATEGTLWTLTVSASDIDSTGLTLVSTDTGSVVSSHFTDNINGTGTFSWTPSFTQAGAYPVTIIASDGTANTTQNFTLNVADANAAPTFSGIFPAVSFVAGTTTTSVLDLDNYFSDIDNQVLTYQATGQVSLTVLIIDGVVTLSAPSTFSGTETVTFTATDPLGATATSDSLIVIVTASDATTPVSNVSHVTGATHGNGTVSVIDANGNVVSEFSAFTEGGVVPQLASVHGVDYIFAVKHRAGSTMAIFDTAGNQIRRVRLSPNLHWRQLAVGQLDMNKNSEEIVTTTKNGSHIRINIYNFYPKYSALNLRKRTIFYGGIKNNKYSVTVVQKAVHLINAQGVTVLDWKPF